MEKYVCSVCGYVYDPAVGVPEEGIAPGTPFDQLPEGFLCPICGVEKSLFEKQAGAGPIAPIRGDRGLFYPPAASGAVQRIRDSSRTAG